MSQKPCQAGRAIIREDDDDWSTPCEETGDHPLWLIDDDVTLLLCHRHMAILDAMGITEEINLN